MTRENLAAALGVRCALRTVRTFDHNLADMWIELKSGYVAGSVHRALEWSVQLRARQIIRREKRRTNGMQPGFHRNARTPGAVASRVGNFFIPIKKFDAFAIDGNFKLFAFDLSKYGLEVTRH